VTDEREALESERARAARVEALARTMVDTINAGTVEERESLREMVVSVLRDEVQFDDPRHDEPSPPATTPPTGTFNSFGIGIPLLLMGTVMVFLFPPVGLLMFAVAAVMIAWGVGATLLARS
jgi:hypothetical protein